MRQSYYILFLAFLLLMACKDDNEDKEFIMTKPPIGETYESILTSITFESKDSVSFCFRYDPIPGGKAKYQFNNGKVTIENPYGKFLPYKEVSESYFYFFNGGFSSQDKLEAKYQLVGEYGAVVIGGTNIWWRNKQPKH